jgi:hypothetical protein
MITGRSEFLVAVRARRLCHAYLHKIYSIKVVYTSILKALETNYECVSTGTNYVSAACFWQFCTSVKNLQVAKVREEPMSLFAGRLTNHAELHHVL